MNISGSPPRRACCCILRTGFLQFATGGVSTSTTCRPRNLLTCGRSWAIKKGTEYAIRLPFLIDKYRQLILDEEGNSTKKDVLPMPPSPCTSRLAGDVRSNVLARSTM